MLRILVIDDDPDTHRILQSCEASASQFEFELVYTGSTQSALAELHAPAKFDIAFVAIDGETEGVKILKHLMEPSLRVALTEGRDVKRICAAIADGAIDFLIKPIAEADFISTIRRVTDQVERRWWVVGWTQAGGRDALRRRTQWLFALRAMTGAAWGIAPVLIVWLGSEVLVITAIVLATGIAVTGFASYGINRAATICITAPIPSLALLLASSNPSFLAIGGALVLVYIHQFVVVGETRRMLANQIRVRVENAILARQVAYRPRERRPSSTVVSIWSASCAPRAIARKRCRRRTASPRSPTAVPYDRRLKSEVSRAFRDRTSLSLVICDVDYFKKFNDLYDHQRGDECLKSFARVLESYSRRGGDLPARIGGEEFALLLPSADHEAALRLAEQARGALDDLSVKHEGSEVKDCVTASFGVSAAVPDDMDVGQTLVARADKALYLAKASGRNRVVSETKLS